MSVLAHVVCFIQYTLSMMVYNFHCGKTFEVAAKDYKLKFGNKVLIGSVYVL